MAVGSSLQKRKDTEVRLKEEACICPQEFLLQHLPEAPVEGWILTPASVKENGGNFS